METGKQLIDAMTRLTQLAKLDSKDANAKAEEAGLQEYMRNHLFEHAGHLLGCWFAIKNEYEPLCNAFASIANRAQGIQRQRLNAEAALAAQDETPADAVVTEADPMAKVEGETDLVAPPGAPMILKPQFNGGKRKK